MVSSMKPAGKTGLFSLPVRRKSRSKVEQRLTNLDDISGMKHNGKSRPRYHQLSSANDLRGYWSSEL